MFRRRHKQSLLSRLRDWFWPRSGWNRAVQYIGHRLGRAPDTSYKVAAGLACGVAVSFTPFVGLHLLSAIVLTFVLRGNILAAALGTLVGNPLTFGFIWVLVYQTGILVLGTESTDTLHRILNSGEVFRDPIMAFEPVLLPMVIGSLPWFVLSWFATFFPARILVVRYKARRRKFMQAGERRKERRI